MVLDLRFLESLPQAVLLVDTEGNIVHANGLADTMFGYAMGDLVGQPLDVVIPEQVRARHAAHVSRYQAAPATRLMTTRGELSAVRKNGEQFPCEVGLSMLDEDGTRRFMAVVQDTSERRRAAEALRSSEERYRLLFQSTPLPTFVFDRDTLRYLTVNDAAVREYGYSVDEFREMTLGDMRPAEDRPRMLEAVERISDPGVHSLGVWRHRKRDGTVIDVEVHAHALEFEGRRAILSVARDLTEERRLEQQLRQAQKMEAVGRLAGGVAHDFNNMLSVVLSYAGMLGDHELDEGAKDDLQEVIHAAERASALTRQLLAFSRQQVIAPRRLDLNGIVVNMNRMLQRIIGEDIELETELSVKPAVVFADPSQVEQILLNLAVNARDAMPRGGRLRVRTALVEVDADDIYEHVGAHPGPHVRLEVSDNGVGMDEETHGHIFEPFFSTKGRNEGTGLGLSTVYGIVQQCDGHIEVQSEPGRGTAFAVLLPCVEGGPVRRPSVVPGADSSCGGRETILLVEDEPPVRRAARSILRRRGYTVLEARDGTEALQVAASHEGPIHLLLTDMVMPKMDGQELVRRLADSRGEVRVLLMSGYAGDFMSSSGELAAGVEFLQKPFTADLLAERVREVLDAQL